MSDTAAGRLDGHRGGTAGTGTAARPRARGRRPDPFRAGVLPVASTPDRRRVLQLALFLPAAAVLGGCATGPVRRAEGPDPLIALADAARADAALAAAAIAADPDLAARLEPLRAARAEHAAALDAEVARAAGGVPATAGADAPGRGSTSAPATPAAGGASATASSAVTLVRVRDAVAGSRRGAAELVPTLPADRVGLVAAVAACCGTYAAALA